MEADEVFDFEQVASLTPDEKRQRYSAIAELPGKHSWESLVESIKEKEVLQKKVMVAALLGNAKDPVALVQYTKGYLDGLRWARSAPKNADTAWRKLSAQTKE